MNCTSYVSTPSFARKIFWKLLLETPACSMISAIVVFRYPCSRKSFTHTCRIRFFVCSLNLVAIGPHLCLLKFQIKSSYDSASGLYTKHNRKWRPSSSSFLVYAPGARHIRAFLLFPGFSHFFHIQNGIPKKSDIFSVKGNRWEGKRNRGTQKLLCTSFK